MSDDHNRRRRRHDGVTVPPARGHDYVSHYVTQCVWPVDHPERLRILEELGRRAAVVHTIWTEGFGHRFAVGGDAADSMPRVQHGAATWSAFLRDDLRAEARFVRLSELGMLSERRTDSLRRTLVEVEAWHGPPVLNHGDLRLKNVVVDAEGHNLGVIDWESAVSVLGPHWDLSIALHDLSIDAKQAFLNGYDLADDEVRRAASVWRLFNVLNYVPTIDELLETDDTLEVERIRTRLCGALDLYGADPHATVRRARSLWSGFDAGMMWSL